MLLGKIRNWTHDKKFLRWFAINLIFLILELIFCQPTYETGDDFGLGVIASGQYGIDSTYLIFSNQILGLFLKIWYFFIPIVNWYIVFQYILVIACYSVIAVFIEKKYGAIVASSINALLWVFVIYNQIRFIQFTRTAYVVSIVGLILIFEGCKENKKLCIISGYLLSFFGYFYRADCFWVGLLYISLYTFVYMLSNRSFYKRILLHGLIIIVAVFCFSLIDKEIYSQSEGWAEYKTYNAARGKILDYGKLDYNLNQEQYESIGFSPNDIATLSQWILNDTEKFTPEKLDFIKKLIGPKIITIEGIAKNIGSFCLNKKTDIWLWIFVLGSVFLFYRRKWLLAISIFFLTVALFIYLYFIGRALPRIEFGIWFDSLIIMALAVYHEGGLRYNKKGTASEDLAIRNKCKIGYVIIGLCILINAMQMKGTDIYSNSSLGILKYLSTKDNVYILDILTFNGACFGYKPYLSVDEDYMGNYMFSGGWESGSPLIAKKMNELGLDNPIKDLLYKDNVYYVVNRDINSLIIFLQENYEEGCTVEVVEQIGSCYVLKFDVPE